MSEASIPIGQLLQDGTRLTQLDLPQWDRVIRHARAAGLLGRLRVAAADADVLERLPESVVRHLESAWLLAERQRESACWEIERMHSILYPAGIPVVLLKGAAYAFTGHPAARGRTFQDIDILVPQGALKDVERLLGSDGWARKQVTPHDRRYYEEWMHEIPPMRHLQRGTNLDLHHAITPPVGRYPVDSAALLEKAHAIPGWDDLYVLSPEDQLLHAIAHLFLEEEFGMGYRDMVDLRLLYRAGLSADPDFPSSVSARARKLGLHRALSQAGNALAEVLEFETPLRARRGLIDALFRQVLLPDHPDLHRPGRSVAAFLLYLRGHTLKLPLRLLLPHLAYKALLAGAAETREQRRNQQASEQLRQMLGPRT